MRNVFWLFPPRLAVVHDAIFRLKVHSAPDSDVKPTGKFTFTRTLLACPERMFETVTTNATFVRVGISGIAPALVISTVRSRPAVPPVGWASRSRGTVDRSTIAAPTANECRTGRSTRPRILIPPFLQVARKQFSKQEGSPPLAVPDLRVMPTM